MFRKVKLDRARIEGGLKQTGMREEAVMECKCRG